MGAGAPSVSSSATLSRLLSSLSGNGGVSCHVHVNVRNQTAPGSLLTCREVLGVFFTWVRFDLVTAQFARPWMWREPSMAPLYASGAEFSWQETAWLQGHRVAAATSTHAGPTIYDVIHFIRAVRDVESTPDYHLLAEHEKFQRLFGKAADTPASRIGR
ncbi:MAG: hypothetical protein SGPRY_004189 [Prymnesium sp.]